MDWKDKRKLMDKELKEKVVPALRQKGFKGSYPHFKRIKENKIDVLGFQFSHWGPQFYVNIARSPIDGITLLDGTHFPPEIVKYNHCGKRSQIGKNPFDFENEDFEEIANKVLIALPDAEDWWTKN